MNYSLYTRPSNHPNFGYGLKSLFFFGRNNSQNRQFCLCEITFSILFGPFLHRNGSRFKMMRVLLSVQLARPQKSSALHSVNRVIANVGRPLVLMLSRHGKGTAFGMFFGFPTKCSTRHYESSRAHARFARDVANKIIHDFSGRTTLAAKRKRYIYLRRKVAPQLEAMSCRTEFGCN